MERAFNSNNHSGSTSTAVEEEEPLPRKPGEIGYDPAIHGPARLPTSRSTTTLSNGVEEDVPLAPHPAERSDSLPTNRNDGLEPTPLSPRAGSHSRTDTNSTAASSNDGAVTDAPLASTSIGQLAPSASTSTNANANQLEAGQSSTSLATQTTQTTLSSLSRFRRKLAPSPKPSKQLFGMSSRSLLKLFLLILFFVGVCAGWGLATSANARNGGDLFSGGGGMNVQVFIHVAFSVIVITQLLFIERTIFRLRAERFAFLHPEMDLGMSSRRRFPGNVQHPHGLSFAPWQRPSLPTYAAALRAAPTATGDVEDQEVARMVALGRGDVPPLYGNTRGSTLLAYGFGAGPFNEHSSSSRSRPGSSSSRFSSRSATLQAPERAHVQMSPRNSSRPVSYGHSQEIEDALRAQKLEETLQQLETSSGGGASRR